MTGQLMLSLLVFAIILMLEWRPLRKSTRSTRMISYSLYALSSAIWVWLQVSMHVPRPAVYLEMLLQPFDILK